MSFYIFIAWFMKKGRKIALYCVIIIAIIAVIYLMFWFPKYEAGEVDSTPEILTWEENMEIEDTYTEDYSFEEDVMEDLEWFFGNANGYENVEWEYWFTDAELE